MLSLWWFRKKPKKAHITVGPWRSAKAFVEFIENSKGVEEDILVCCLLAYPMPPRLTGDDILDLIRTARTDLKHYGLKTR